MSLTNAQLRSLLKANLHNDSTFSDPADLDVFLTLGQERIVKDAPHVLGMKQGTLALTAAAGRSYVLASDFYQMHSVFYPTDSSKLVPMAKDEWIDEVEAQSSIPTGMPEQYCVWGYGTIDASSGMIVKFDTTPNANYTVYYWYYWIPAAISGSGTCAISAIGFADLLLQAATMLALQRNDPEGHAVALANYDRLLVQYRAYRADSPAYTPTLRPDGDRGFSRLGSHYPVDTW